MGTLHRGAVPAAAQALGPVPHRARHDAASQAFTLELALRTLESAPGPRTTVQSPLRWSDNPDWKLDYGNIDRLTPDEIQRRRAEFDQAKSEAKQLREAVAAARRNEDRPA